MTWPKSRCESCPMTTLKRNGRCRAQILENSRFCENSKNGNRNFDEFLIGDRESVAYVDRTDATHVIGIAISRSGLGQNQPRPLKEKRPLPRLSVQIANLAASAVRFVRSGFAISTKELQSKRMSICQGSGDIPACEHFLSGRCGLCGCNLEYKVISEPESCPIGKW